MKHLTIALAGLTTAGLLALSPVGAANAAHAQGSLGRQDVVTQSAHHPVVAKQKKRTVTLEGKKTGHVTFTLYGKIAPKYRTKKVFLFFKTTQHGKFQKVRTTKSSQFSRYNFPKVSRVGFYTVGVPAAQGLKASTSQVVKIYRL